MSVAAAMPEPAALLLFVLGLAALPGESATPQSLITCSQKNSCQALEEIHRGELQDNAFLERGRPPGSATLRVFIQSKTQRSTDSRK